MFLRWARDATAVQHHLLGALYPKAARGLPIVAGKGYIGAGIGIHAPTQGKTLDPDARSRNRIICELRAPCERANAMLKSWKALQHVTFCPQKIGQIVAAVLVLTHMKYPSNYPWRENLNVCPRWGAPTGQDPENRFNLSTPIHKPARC
jgi:hypothetical protein